MRFRTLFSFGGTILAGTLIAAVALVRSVQQSPLHSLARAKDRLNQDCHCTTLLQGTNRETAVYEVASASEGPTAVIIGGIHGNEVNGYRVAADITNWKIDTGRLVVIPLANMYAIERNIRSGPHGDLNRLFPAGQDPSDDLARAIWRVVESVGPDVVIDLHRSRGLITAHHRWMGQAIFPTEAGDALNDARSVSMDMNTQYVPRSMRFHRFTTKSVQHRDRDTEFLIQKVDHDLGVAGFLVESTDFLLDLDTQIRWTTAVTELLLERHGITRTA